MFSLTKQDILSELLDLILQEPSPDLEEKLRFKLPNIASEVITCDVPQVRRFKSILKFYLCVSRSMKSFLRIQHYWTRCMHFWRDLLH